MEGIIDESGEQKVRGVNERKTKDRELCEGGVWGEGVGRKERENRRAPGWRTYEGYIHGVHPFVLVITICALSDAAHSFSGRCARAAVAFRCIANRTGLCGFV